MNSVQFNKYKFQESSFFDFESSQLNMKLCFMQSSFEEKNSKRNSHEILMITCRLRNYSKRLTVEEQEIHYLLFSDNVNVQRKK